MVVVVIIVDKHWRCKLSDLESVSWRLFHGDFCSKMLVMESEKMLAIGIFTFSFASALKSERFFSCCDRFFFFSVLA